ncbi:hypothetical protein HanRHA438_Chr09g0420311 [Helianthus annuus]|nr:hypothetical protein HanRHA438_Chr09g0420311 [Helianthus annuus]
MKSYVYSEVASIKKKVGEICFILIIFAWNQENHHGLTWNL